MRVTVRTIIGFVPEQHEANSYFAACVIAVTSGP
jgi:hypothetical protein